RAGTPLLLSMRSCHPHLLAIPNETAALCPTAYELPDAPDLTAPFDLDDLRDALACEIGPRVRRWMEKTPRNVLYFERILEELWPDARLINVVRDGRDVITS